MRRPGSILALALASLAAPLAAHAAKLPARARGKRCSRYSHVMPPGHESLANLPHDLLNAADARRIEFATEQNLHRVPFLSSAHRL